MSTRGLDFTYDPISKSVTKIDGDSVEDYVRSLIPYPQGVSVEIVTSAAAAVSKLLTEKWKAMNPPTLSVMTDSGGLFTLADACIQAASQAHWAKVNSGTSSANCSEVGSGYEEKEEKKKGQMIATVHEVETDDVSDADSVYDEKMGTQKEPSPSTSSSWLWSVFTTCGGARR